LIQYQFQWKIKLVMVNRVLPILIVLILIGILLKEPFLIHLSIALLVIIGVAWWWYKRSMVGVSYQRWFHYNRGFPGETIKLIIDAENRKLLPISWLRIQDDWDRAVGPEDEEILAPSHIPDRGFLTNVFSLRWYEKARRSYSLLLRRRGIYALGPAKVDTGDLFGIFEKTRIIDKNQYLTVFPSLLPFTKLGFPAVDPFGDRRSRRRLFEDPNRPMGVREYRPEDSFRKVHWPATARTGQLQVKVYQPTSGQVMIVCMNVSTFTRHWEGVNPELLEHLVKTAATIVDEGIREGYKVGLVANGCLAHADQPFRIPPGRSPQQLAVLLQALAGVTSVVTGNFDRFLLKEIPRIQYGATLVIITAVTTAELAPTLIQLKQHEHRITLLSLSKETPPIIPGVQTIHKPFQTSNRS
jgi:uncharacterized protein (DUF58 family)